MAEPKWAIASIGPWTGLRVTDENKQTILFVDQCAKTDLIGLAITSLQQDPMIWERDGVQYQTPGGVPFALQILKAIQ